MGEKYNNYIGRGWTRHEAFQDILRRNPPRDEYRKGDIVVLNVRFTYSGHTYCYISKDDVYEPGDLVEVKVRGESKVVTVDSVGYYSKEEYPFEGVGLNTVIGPASGDLAEKYRRAIEAEKQEESEAEKIRAEAKAILEEAKIMKAEAEEEKEKAYELKEKAEKQIAEVEKIRDEAEQAKQEVIEANRRIVDRALLDLETRMRKVRDKAAQLSESDDATQHVKNTLEKLDTLYIPKTNELIDHYRDIFSEIIPNDDLEQLRNDALEAIDKSKDVYDNILASLFESDMLDLYAEMKALQAMFKIAGLTDSDFDIES